jgi:phage repressor protein C with HTH and peptisase S24 domain
MTTENRRNRIRFLAAERGLTIAELAVQIGMQPHTLRRYTRHEAEPKLEIAEKVAEVLGVSIDDVLGTEIGTVKMEEVVASNNKNGRRIPVYGAAQGGVGFDITQVDTPVDSIIAPEYLDSCPDPYGVYVVGESMEPRFFAGEILLVHPGKPVRTGDWVVVQFRAGPETHAIVKRFVRAANGHVVLQQLNPDKELRYDRADIVAIHKVVGTKLL